LLRWCDLNNTRVSSVSQLDVCVTNYFHSLFHTGAGFHHASYALYGLYNDSPRLRGELKEAEAALAGWKKVEPVHRRPPISWEVAVCMAMWMATHGYVAEGIATLVSFVGYFRISEVTSMLVQHVSTQSDPRLGSAYSGVAVYLPKSKTGDFQSVKIDNGPVAKLLSTWVRKSGRRSTDTVFGITAPQYRDMMQRACVALHIDDIGFTPHCLRHGGATRDFMRGIPLEQVLLVGRWESSKSSRTYIKQGLGLMLTAALPRRVTELGIKYGADVYASILPFLLCMESSSN
jgi:hypothetical protein